MNKSIVRQSGNRVEGNLIGRDDNSVTQNYLVDPSKTTPMGELIRKFEEEYKEDAQFHQTVEKLQHYKQLVPNEKVVGLESKMEAGGHTDMYDFALMTKEMFSKKLTEHELSESAQKIFAYLLSTIYVRFNRFVYPEICQGASKDEINMLVQTAVIDNVEALLEKNVLELYAEEINGMLYFLTGNCHIKWVK